MVVCHGAGARQGGGIGEGSVEDKRAGYAWVVRRLGVGRQEAMSRSAHVASCTRRDRSSTITGTRSNYFSFPFIYSSALDDFLSPNSGGCTGAGARRFSPPSVTCLLYKGVSLLGIALEFAR